MRCIFQVVNSETGQRTEPVSSTRGRFARVLADRLSADLADGVRACDYVLVISEEEIIVEPADPLWRISQAPLVVVSSFVELFSTVDVEEVNHG